MTYIEFPIFRDIFVDLSSQNLQTKIIEISQNEIYRKKKRKKIKFCLQPYNYMNIKLLLPIGPFYRK